VAGAWTPVRGYGRSAGLEEWAYFWCGHHIDCSATCRVHASWVAAPSIVSRVWRTACTRIRRACTDSDVRTIDPYCAPDHQRDVIRVFTEQPQ
jgi:hypothetical protein